MINVKDFGATGNGLTDDTDAIQKAIDFLQVPIAGTSGSSEATKLVTGGVVYLPIGTYLLSRPLKLQTSVALSGDGSGISILYAPSTTAIELTTRFGHAYHIGGRIEFLKIVTDDPGCMGITVDDTVNCISALTINDVVLCCGGTGIELYRPYVQQSLFNRITGLTIGGALIRCFGNANEFNALVTEGGNRPEFKVEKGVVTLKGSGLSISNCIIESWEGPIAYYFEEAQINYRQNWMEARPGEHHIAYMFDRCSGFIDDLHLIGPIFKAKFKQCTDLHIGSIGLDGFSSTNLGGVTDIDDESCLTIDHIRATWDSGYLDHPRIKINSVFSKIGKWQLNLPVRVKNTIPTTAFSSPSVWTVQASKPSLLYTFSTDNAPGRMGRRVKLVVRENPERGRVSLLVNLKVVADDAGTPGVAKWKLENAQAEIWHLPSWQQLTSRCEGSLTAVKMPWVLQVGDQLMFNLFSPGEEDGALKIGNYYLSDLEVGPEMF